MGGGGSNSVFVRGVIAHVFYPFTADVLWSRVDLPRLSTFMYRMYSREGQATTRATLDTEQRLPLLLATLSTCAWQRLRVVKLSFEYHRGSLQPIPSRTKDSLYEESPTDGFGSAGTSGNDTLQTTVEDAAVSGTTTLPCDDGTELEGLLTALGEISEELDRTLSCARLHQLQTVQLGFVDRLEKCSMSEDSVRRFLVSLCSAVEAMFPELGRRGLLDVKFSSRDGECCFLLAR